MSKVSAVDCRKSFINEAIEQLIDDADRIQSHSVNTVVFGKAEIAKHIDKFPIRYATIVSGQEILTHMRLLTKIDENENLEYVVSCDPFLGSTMQHDDGCITVKIIIICAGTLLLWYIHSLGRI